MAKDLPGDVADVRSNDQIVRMVKRRLHKVDGKSAEFAKRFQARVAEARERLAAQGLQGKSETLLGVHKEAVAKVNTLPVRTGKRGGRYVMIDGKKRYI